MAFRIRNNYEADVALTNLYANRTKLSKLEQQLATGLRIVRAADDATDLFIADNLKQTHVGLQRGTQNAQYGLAAARVVDDALGRIYDILVKIKDKAVEAANAHTKQERYQAQQQINEYVRNIAQIIKTTEFDGVHLLYYDPTADRKNYTVHFGSHKDGYLIINGTAEDKGGTYLKVFAGSTDTAAAALGFVAGSVYTTVTKKSNLAANATDKIKGYDNLAASTAYTVDLGASAITLDVTNAENARSTIANVEKFIKAIDKLRGYYAGIENKLQNIIENNQVLIDNLKEGESVVRNIDYASAMAEFNKMRVITQANVAALAQANQIPQLVMQLLR